MLVLGIGLLATVGNQASATPGRVAKPAKVGFAQVPGISLYYEIHGKGDPLIVLHGGIAASEVFGPNIGALARGRQVIAVHLQGHGKTKDVDRPLRYETMADDIAALIGHLGLGKVDLLGLSLGGGVALQTAFRHPALIDRLVIVSMKTRPISNTSSRRGWRCSSTVTTASSRPAR